MYIYKDIGWDIGTCPLENNVFINYLSCHQVQTISFHISQPLYHQQFFHSKFQVR